MSTQQKEIDFLSLSQELPEILIDFLCEHCEEKEGKSMVGKLLTKVKAEQSKNGIH
jgi:hypothetical protein